MIQDVLTISCSIPFKVRADMCILKQSRLSKIVNKTGPKTEGWRSSASDEDPSVRDAAYELQSQEIIHLIRLDIPSMSILRQCFFKMLFAQYDDRLLTGFMEDVLSNPRTFSIFASAKSVYERIDIFIGLQKGV